MADAKGAIPPTTKIVGFLAPITMKEYSCIIKTSSKQFVKYRTVRDLLKFTIFLDAMFPEWRYYNVYDKTTKQQIASFTKNNRPQQSVI